MSPDLLLILVFAVVLTTALMIAAPIVRYKVAHEAASLRASIRIEPGSLAISPMYGAGFEPNWELGTIFYYDFVTSAPSEIRDASLQVSAFDASNQLIADSSVFVLFKNPNVPQKERAQLHCSSEPTRIAVSVKFVSRRV